MTRPSGLAMLAFGIGVAICGALATAGEPNPKHFHLDGDKITFAFGTTDDDMVVLAAHPTLKMIVMGGGDPWDGPDRAKSPSRSPILAFPISPIARSSNSCSSATILFR